MKILPPHIRRFLACAQAGAEMLSPDEREDYYQAIVDLLPLKTEEADAASYVLSMIRAARRAQSEFTQLVNQNSNPKSK